MAQEEDETSPPRAVVAASDTVPPKVNWEERQFTDKVWGVLYLLALIAFLACGFTLMSKAHPRYTFHEATVTTDEINGIEIYETVEVRVVSDHFKDSVAQCCANKGGVDDGWDLCSELTLDDAVRRRRLQFEERRRLQEEDDTSTPATLHKSKLEQGDGMFDAFLEAPHIAVTLSFLALFLALLWIVLIRYFATPIVFATEAIKAAFFFYLMVRQLMEGATGSAIVALVCALGTIGWGIYTRKQLLFAGKVLSHAAKSFKENMAMFCAFIPVLGLYSFNAYLFVTFYAKSFEVVEVQEWENCYADYDPLSPTYGQEICYTSCYYWSPSYTTGMVVYISLTYLWSVLLFSQMRLSIIANVIGSWHFHPENQPGIAKAVRNTCTTSMGTLSVSSLITTVAEKLNRLFLTETLWQQCCNPIFCILLPFYLCFGYCIKMFIIMLTKFSVILHVFTGKSWLGSAKKVFKIMKRHFKGGFVTEYASTNVLTLGSYVFSISIFFICWVWMDREFKTETFIGINEDSFLVILWVFFGLFNIWYPVLGIFVLIVVSRWLSKWDFLAPTDWVVPFAASFVGCIAMMFFTYLGGIFLDTVDVLFLCFAVDRDNHRDLSNDEFAKLVNEGVDTVITDPDWSEGDANDAEWEGEDNVEPVVPAMPVVVTGIEPMEAPTEKSLDA